MKPSQVAAALRDIATKIDRSKSPDRRLVASAVKRVLIAMGEPSDYVIRVAPDKWVVVPAATFHTDNDLDKVQRISPADVLNNIAGKTVYLVTGFLHPGETDEWATQIVNGDQVTEDQLNQMLDLAYG